MVFLPIFYHFMKILLFLLFFILNLISSTTHKPTATAIATTTHNHSHHHHHHPTPNYQNHKQKQTTVNPQSPPANPTQPNKPTVTTIHHHPPTYHHCQPQPKINPPLATTTTKQPPNYKTQTSQIINYKTQTLQITNHKTKTQPPNHKTTTITNAKSTHHKISPTTKSDTPPNCDPWPRPTMTKWPTLAAKALWLAPMGNWWEREGKGKRVGERKK